MNHCCYCFDGLQRMKTKYIVLCVNALAKYQNARGASHHLVFMVNYGTFSFMPWPYQFINRLLSVCSRSCAGHEILWPRERCLCLEKKVDMKCMQLNTPKNIERMTRRLCILIMSHIHFKVNLHSVV